MRNTLKPLLLITVVTLLLITIGSPFTGCKKTVTKTEHDTTLVPVHDTTIIHDTTVINDTFYDLKNGLIAYYNFNNGSLHDWSGYNNNIVFSNAIATTDRFGRENNAFYFDGSSNYMRIPNNYSLNPKVITLFAIIKINSFNGGFCHANSIIDKSINSQVLGRYFLSFTDYASDCASPTADTSQEQFTGVFGDNTVRDCPNVIVNYNNARTGKWYYLAYTYDGHSSSFYINGEFKGSTQYQGPFTDNGLDLFIGKRNDPVYQNFFHGVMDEIRIYNRALSAKEVEQLSKLKN